MDDKREGGDTFDPDFCEKRCPVCTRARLGKRWAKFLQSIEMLVKGLEASVATWVKAAKRRVSTTARPTYERMNEPNSSEERTGKWKSRKALWSWRLGPTSMRKCM